MRKSTLRQLVKEVIDEMGQMKHPSTPSPKYKRAKELALTDFQLGHDAGYEAVRTGQQPEGLSVKKTKSWMAGFQAGVSAGQDECLERIRNPYGLRR